MRRQGASERAWREHGKRLKSAATRARHACGTSPAAAGRMELLSRADQPRPLFHAPTPIAAALAPPRRAAALDENGLAIIIIPHPHTNSTRYGNARHPIPSAAPRAPRTQQNSAHAQGRRRGRDAYDWPPSYRPPRDERRPHGPGHHVDDARDAAAPPPGMRKGGDRGWGWGWEEGQFDVAGSMRRHCRLSDRRRDHSTNTNQRQNTHTHTHNNKQLCILAGPRHDHRLVRPLRLRRCALDDGRDAAAPRRRAGPRDDRRPLMI